MTPALRAAALDALNALARLRAEMRNVRADESAVRDGRRLVAEASDLVRHSLAAVGAVEGRRDNGPTEAS